MVETLKRAMPAIVRRAEASDLTGIRALYRELRPNDPELAPEAARDAFANLLAQNDLDVVVCEADQVLVATCMLATIPNLASGARPFGVIEHVVTLSIQRRRGYARLVLEHTLARAWSRGCYKVVLLSGVERAEAHQLYASVGFAGNIERGFVAKPSGAV
jgi:GNAT superfamily N-acetyltransferase